MTTSCFLVASITRFFHILSLDGGVCWMNGKHEWESMDEIMIHYASIGSVIIMFDEWDHPTSGQVD